MDDSLPEITGDPRYWLCFAFALGANAAMQTCGLPNTVSDKAKVVDTLGEIANGELTLLDTAAELLLKGKEFSPHIDQRAFRDEKQLARIIWSRLRGQEG